jgi:hypothetical protein
MLDLKNINNVGFYTLLIAHIFFGNKIKISIYVNPKIVFFLGLATALRITNLKKCCFSFIFVVFINNFKKMWTISRVLYPTCKMALFIPFEA